MASTTLLNIRSVLECCHRMLVVLVVEVVLLALSDLKLEDNILSFFIDNCITRSLKSKLLVAPSVLSKMAQRLAAVAAPGGDSYDDPDMVSSDRRKAIKMQRMDSVESNDYEKPDEVTTGLLNRNAITALQVRV